MDTTMIEGETEIRSLLTLVADPEACKQRLEVLAEAYNKEREAKGAASLVKKQVELSRNDVLKLREQIRQEKEDLRAATLEHDCRKREAENAEESARHAADALKDRIQTLDHREALV